MLHNDCQQPLQMHCEKIEVRVNSLGQCYFDEPLLKYLILYKIFKNPNIVTPLLIKYIFGFLVDYTTGTMHSTLMSKQSLYWGMA